MLMLALLSESQEFGGLLDPIPLVQTDYDIVEHRSRVERRERVRELGASHGPTGQRREHLPCPPVYAPAPKPAVEGRIEPLVSLLQPPSDGTSRHLLIGHPCPRLHCRDSATQNMASTTDRTTDQTDLRPPRTPFSSKVKCAATGTVTGAGAGRSGQWFCRWSMPCSASAE